MFILVAKCPESAKLTVTVVVNSGIEIREVIFIVSVTGGIAGGEVSAKLVLILEEVVMDIVVMIVCVTEITTVETDARLEAGNEVGIILWLLINDVLVKVVVGGEKIDGEVGLLGIVLHEVGSYAITPITVVYGLKGSCDTTGIICFPLPI